MIAIDGQGNLYITEGRFLDLGERTYGFRVRKIAPDGQVTALAGTGEPGYRDGPALNAQFDVPIGVAVDENGNVYVVDSGAHRIRRISPEGVVSTVAGSGVAAQTISRPVGPQDIAATIAAYLEIKPPSGSVGVPLVEVPFR